MKENTNFSFVVKFHIRRVLTRMKKIDIKFKNFLFFRHITRFKQITSFTFIEIVS